MQIDGRSIPVTWEENESTAELKRQAAKGNITIPLSPYGGFEQVGSLGRAYPASDVRQTAESGGLALDRAGYHAGDDLFIEENKQK